MWKPRRCHIHKLTCPIEKSLKLSESSVAADGSLLSCPNVQQRSDAAQYGHQISKGLKCYVYHLLGKISRVGSIHASIRLRGMSGTVFYRAMPTIAGIGFPRKEVY